MGGSGKSLRVAAAQIESHLNDLEANVEKHLAVIDEARAAGVDVLLFPEMSLTGHGAGNEVLRLAIDRDDPQLQRLADATGDMTTIVGLMEEAVAAQFYNTAIALHNGEQSFLHRKINLATYGRLEDGKHFATGRYVDTFELDGPWRSSVMICADLWNPGLVNLVALHGCTVLFAPISSAIEAVGGEFDNPAGWHLNVRFYGMTYGLPLVMANRVGREGDLKFWGGSCVVDPFGRMIAEAESDEETLVQAELDYDQVRRARYLLPTVRDSNLSLVLREAQRLEGVIGVPVSVRDS
ncbi:MAG: nitrilase-related carbon-nitrogen hydrolase [Halofilum sp. (in: g-proteobacteria)]|nr:nitrilase-related carbon-nitrogen hydrolase [Halofilum sp. (in: g-proteobacteria)]